MTSEATLTENTVKRQAVLLDIYLKAVAIVMLGFAVGYWTRLVGLVDPGSDFSTLGLHWQIALSLLVVFQPVTALGLWGNMRWGIVTWIVVIVTEVTMYAGFPHLFGRQTLVLLFHAASFAMYLLIIIALWFQNRRMEK